MSEAEGVSQVSAEAEKMVQSVCGNHTCELTKDGAGQSHNNQVSFETKIGEASHMSSNCRSIDLIDKNSNHGQVVRQPPCDADCQSTLCETSEQKKLVDDGCLQSELVKSCSMVSGLSHNEHNEKSLSPEKFASERACNYGHDDVFESEVVRETCKVPDDVVPGQLMSNPSIESSEFKHSIGGINETPENISGGCTEAHNKDVNDQLGQSFQDVSTNLKCERLEPLPDDKSKCSDKLYQVVLALKSAAENCSAKKSGATYQQSGRRHRRTQAEDTNGRNSGRRQRKIPSTKVKTAYKLRSSSADRRKGRRSGIQEKSAASEPDSNTENASSGRKRGRKKVQRNRELHDEFSRMRVHLRYLLHRIRYEQNLIDAYSSEGWRGQSLEKLRPEKELERAKMDINRSKLKIRGLFQHLDTLSAEGRFPESLFDSEGLVDSEDIFCAKCGCKELSPNNDIILCDGSCDRGFHQLCLDPPLRTEEIPPGDEGWFCPACDCRFDCVELLNDSMGTKLSISHSFENVFPEAATKAGSAQDDIDGLPSDDSEDNDYNPDGADDDDDNDDDDNDNDDDNVEGGESIPDESDFSSASEDLRAIHNTDDQYLGLPSDDSEDDDFDPNFVDAEGQPMQRSSSSDFTSASEDLNAAVENDEISSKNKHLMSPSELFQDCDDSVLVTGRRQADKLDYKKLYDETYGNASTDSSDDEDWHDAATPQKRKNGGKDTSSHSSKGEEYRVTPKRSRRNTSTTHKPSWSPKVGGSSDSPNPETSSNLKANKRQSYMKLGEDIVQRLYASFRENQYPDRSTKDNLAAELGLSPKKVSKWFENTRWSVKHPAGGDASTSRNASRGRRRQACPATGATSPGAS